MSENRRYPLISLSEVLVQDKEYITELESHPYPKLSVKLYGRGVVLDEPTDGATVRMKRHQLAKPGQVILSEIWAKKGAIGIVPEEGAGALVTSHFFLFDIVESKLLRPYMGWLLAANYFEPVLSGKARGTTGYAAVRPKQFLECKIPLPPLDEQRRIVAHIEELAALIEEARGLRVKAREEVEALMSTALAKVFAQADEERWPQKSLNDVAPVNMGQSPSGDTYNQDAEGLPLLNGPTEFGTKYPKPVQWTSEPTKVCNRGDILICVRGATTGRMNWADQIYCIGRGLAALTPNPSQCLPEYVHYFLQHKTRIILAEARGSTFPNLPGEKLKTFPIPVPPLGGQHRIAAYLDDLQAQLGELTTLQEATQAELDALLPSVLDRAFRGEL